MISTFHPAIEPAIDIFKKLKINVGLDQISETELTKFRRKEIGRLKNFDFDSLRRFSKYFFKERYNNQQLVLRYIDIFIEKIGAQKGNKTWRKSVVGKRTMILVDVNPETVIQYNVEYLHKFFDLYGAYLRNDITLQVIEKLIAELKSSKVKPFRGRISEAAEKAVKNFIRYPNRFGSRRAAAKDFFDKHSFVGRPKYTFTRFMSSVKKVIVK